jgi:uncharacterized repeat protein (TIGR03843 family)
MIRNSNNLLSILESGEMEVTGEFLWGSNYTFAVDVSRGDQVISAVYKPSQGERPLWDFPRESLAHREVAAFLVSEEIGWKFVPPTVFRKDGPAGAGSLQLFIPHDPEYNYFNFKLKDLSRLRPVSLFDILINNADRKGSHVLVDENDHLWLIDHGVSFHHENKLRTVIWDFAGQSIPDELCQDLTVFESKFKAGSSLAEQLERHLSQQEIAALITRTRNLLQNKRFPNPHPNRRPYPWPPI